ncbi:type 4a pilus biogenesis protein PilO [Psychrobacter lutiphocae]|uniref:type 4a pilus biogenesis protein PilO n=1 Tax=Psychrobacter lutiphocae TaxID=540500 RepID=UPI0003638808|nr:type 4a pilus biogenesis protein PilO [Psychrobacter lutiphocae]
MTLPTIQRNSSQQHKLKHQSKYKSQYRWRHYWYRLQSLDSQYYGSWPLAIKLTVIAIPLLLIVFVAYLLPIRAKQQQLVAQQAQQQVLLASYQQKSMQAATQQTYIQQTQQAQQQLIQQFGRLTADGESSKLLAAINKVALSSGVVLQDIALAEKSEKILGQNLDLTITDTADIARVESAVATQLPEQVPASYLYTEQPIDMVVIGGYHNLGLFVTGLSALPQAISIQGFAVKHANPLLLDPKQLSLLLHTKVYHLPSEKEATPLFIGQEP